MPVVMRPPIPSVSLSRRGKIILGVIVALFVILTIANSLVGVYVDWLWFGEVKYRSVYKSILGTRVVLILVFGLLMAAVLAANIVVAYLMRPPFRPLSAEQQNLERYRVILESRKKLAFAAVIIIAGLTAGLSAQSNWQAWTLWRNGGSFGIKDPQFGKDISFFAFDYPIYRILLGFGFSMVIFSLIFSVALHYLFGSIRLQTPGPKISVPARRHITVLIFAFILLKAVAYWLDRYGLVYSDRGKVTGASYTDVNASLPAKTILFWIAVIIAIAVFASIWLKSARLPAISFVVLLILSIVINGIYPALVQQFTVKPNASDKEAVYIKRNIDATRQAYNVVTNTTSDTSGNVTYSSFDPASDPSTTEVTSTNPNPTVDNIRILDPNVVSSTFDATQQLQNYYGFASKLDIDRYTLADPTTGKQTTRDYVVGVRELDTENLTGDQTNWINRHTVYTHGYGFVAAAADTDITNDRTAYTEKDIPPTGPLNLKVPQVYYGELDTDYAVVGAQPAREADGQGKTSYTGSGGISLDNFFTRLAFAAQYKETNFLLNDAVTSAKGKMMIVRDPRDRVQKVAPFLKVDGDPYPVVDSTTGHIVWMVDAYTTMATYPYSEKNSLASLTSDSLTTSDKTAAQPDDQVNYIRNSVKATVDAYDGTVKLYQWDNTDPLIKAWSKAFPGLIQPQSAMPPELASHVRYPQDLFEAQRSILQQYHVDDPVQFYNQSDKWTVPTDPASAQTSSQPPYYVLAASPTDRDDATAAPQFQLTTPMRVNGRPYLAAYISVDSDPGADYGKITVLRLPSGSSVDGPEQVYAKFNANAVISKDITQLSGTGSTVIHGNLLTLPIGDSFLYVEPLYVRGVSSGAFPILQRVLVEYGGTLGYGTTLAQALANLNEPIVGQEISSAGATSTPSSSAPSSAPPSSAAPSGGSGIDATLTQLNAAFTNLQNAYKSGDLAKIGEYQSQVQALTQQYLAQRSAGASTSSSPGSASSGAAATSTAPTPTPKPAASSASATP